MKNAPFVSFRVMEEYPIISITKDSGEICQAHGWDGESLNELRCVNKVRYKIGRKNGKDYVKVCEMHMWLFHLREDFRMAVPWVLYGNHACEEDDAAFTRERWIEPDDW